MATFNDPVPMRDPAPDEVVELPTITPETVGDWVAYCTNWATMTEPRVVYQHCDIITSDLPQNEYLMGGRRTTANFHFLPITPEITEAEKAEFVLRFGEFSASCAPPELQIIVHVNWLRTGYAR